MNLQEAVQYLLENGYMVTIKGKYKVTAKFSKEMTGEGIGLVSTPTGLTVREESSALSLQRDSPDWTQAYIKFIQEAQVPQRGEGKGGSYDLNKYSERAAKAFRRALEKEKVQYSLLVRSTMLYYKTHRNYPVSISRYIEEGLWRTDYQALEESLRQGTLSDHIQQEIDHDTDFSRYQVG